MTTRKEPAGKPSASTRVAPRKTGKPSQPPAKKSTAPAKTTGKPKSADVETVDLRERIAAALAAGFGVKQLNDATNPGSSFIWAARRTPQPVDHPKGYTAKLAAYLDRIDKGEVTAPERVAAAAGGGPSKRELASRVNAATVLLSAARDANGAAALKHAVTEALDVLTGERAIAEDDIG